MIGRPGVNRGGADQWCRDCSTPAPAGDSRCPACGSPRLVGHPEAASLAIAHLDCDAFFAAIHKRDDPTLRDRPVLVGGGRRGVVATCCYIARAAGVRSAMPMFKARALCPDAVIVRPQMELYRAESRRIGGMLAELTPLVEFASIDEAYLDLSGSERLHGGPPLLTLIGLQRRIEAETGLAVSIGLAANKAMAKFASELDKPRGFAVIGRADARAVLGPKPVRALHGVGPGLAARLTDAGLATIADVAVAPPDLLFRLAGAQAPRLARLALGEDDRPVDPDGDRKSISAETTFETDMRGGADLEAVLWRMCERVARRARDTGCAGRVVTLKLKSARFETVTRRRTLHQPTQLARTLFAAARDMLTAETGAGSYRLIGLGLSDLQDAAGADLGDLVDASPRRIAALERAEDRLRARFGAAALMTGRALASARADTGPGARPEPRDSAGRPPAPHRDE